MSKESKESKEQYNLGTHYTSDVHIWHFWQSRTFASAYGTMYNAVASQLQMTSTFEAPVIRSRISEFVHVWENLV